ncbi:MAG: UDP-N-acetylmuramate--L-alanine ligase [Treponemataceae bacterium]
MAVNIENTFPKSLDGVCVHFVGIKGTGMVALAEICVNRGAIVSGSDVEERFYTDEILEKLNITSKVFDKKNINNAINFVIYSSAYKLTENIELIEACKKNIPCILYSEALGQISSLAKSSGIAGVHGKTTTTAFVGSIIKELNFPAQVLAGSIVKAFGNCTLSIGHEYFIAETCEYQRNFMHFHPQNIILTSVESDHQDYYPTFKDIQNAFVDYGCLLPKSRNLIFCADDVGAVETANIISKKRPDINLISYGFNAEKDFRIIEHKTFSGKQVFKLAFNPDFCFELNVPGTHNVRNSTAAIALSQILFSDFYNKKSFSQFSPQEQSEFLIKTKKALCDFSGSKRRSELVGKFTNKTGNEVIVIDDYAHHPTAIKTTLEGFRKFYPDKFIIVDFMSHTYSRTLALIEEFASSFENCDEVILHKIYASAREKPTDFEDKVSGKILYKKTSKYFPHKKISYFEEIFDATTYVTNRINILPENSKNGYVFITMGAGDNWKLGRKILGIDK